MQALEKIAYSNSWVTLLLLLLFLSIVLLKVIDAKRLKESFFAIFNFTLIKSDDIEGKRFYDPFQIIIFIFSVATISLLVLHLKLYKVPENIGSLDSFLSLFTGLLFYFLIKRIFENALSSLFLIRNSLENFMLSKTNYLYSISFLIYIVMILSEYVKINQVYVFCFAAFLFIIRFVFVLSINKKLIFNKLFYFILYICAFEIAPLFVLFKLMF